MREAYGLGGALIAEDQQELGAWAVHMIRLSGLPMRYSGFLGPCGAGRFCGGRRASASAVTDGSAQQAENQIVVEFSFPRSESIVLEDREVEFVTKLGQFDVKKKFTLKDMVFKGKLEL